MTARTRIVGPREPEWAAVLARTRHDVYQTPGWASTSAPIDKGDPFAVVVTISGRSMLVPFIRRQLPSGDWDAVTPYGYSGPIADGGVVDDGFADEAFCAAADLLAKEGGVSWFVRLHPFLNDAWHPAIGDTVTHGDTVAIDLTREEAEQWSTIRSGHRSEINRARRDGLRSEWSDSDRDWMAFAEMYRATMEILGATEYYLFPDEHFRMLRASLGEACRLRAVTRDSDLVGGALFLLSPSTSIVHYHLSANADVPGLKPPTKLILDDVRRWASGQGYTRLHLGGGVGSAADSLFRFKLGFSPLTVQFRTLRCILNQARYDALTAQLPDSRDATFFPAYRAPLPV